MFVVMMFRDRKLAAESNETSDNAVICHGRALTRLLNAQPGRRPRLPSHRWRPTAGAQPWGVRCSLCAAACQIRCNRVALNSLLRACSHQLVEHTPVFMDRGPHACSQRATGTAEIGRLPELRVTRERAMSAQLEHSVFTTRVAEPLAWLADLLRSIRSPMSPPWRWVRTRSGSRAPRMHLMPSLVKQLRDMSGHVRASGRLARLRTAIDNLCRPGWCPEDLVAAVMLHDFGGRATTVRWPWRSCAASGRRRSLPSHADGGFQSPSQGLGRPVC